MRKYEVISRQTLDVMADLKKEGIKKMSALIRHSERFFSDSFRKEPFMHLTQDGQSFAFDFGMQLEPSMHPLLFCSFISRCVETAYLIDKGFASKHYQLAAHPEIDTNLSPFYLIDIEQIAGRVIQDGDARFLRDWFDHKIDPGIIMPPKEACNKICRIMTGYLERLEDGQTAICVSHDWNLFPVKEFILDLHHETIGDIGYLEGLVFFEKGGTHYVTGYQGGPVML